MVTNRMAKTKTETTVFPEVCLEGAKVQCEMWELAHTFKY